MYAHIGHLMVNNRHFIHQLHKQASVLKLCRLLWSIYYVNMKSYTFNNILHLNVTYYIYQQDFNHCIFL